ncbi:glycerol-3-phosphate phosphatase [Cephus cinctus]|uniref:Glycerol-3-phosphate phosphatase n=1 Tax=Cephus cinctus TaxID=211228 RepID=A0AAJ7C313_CEPCN|nr:glycerol-3-phosphate phosphatase [Cephus cinctus]
MSIRPATSSFCSKRNMTPKYVTRFSKDELKSFVDSFDVVLSDCDGVLWRETEAVPGSPEAVKKFKEMGKRFFYVTNNNTKTREELFRKAKALNYDASPEEIVCTSFLTAMYLKEKNFDKTVYIVGSDGIGKELDAVGIKHIGIGPDVMEGDDDVEMIKAFKPNAEVGAVVVGLDVNFSYPKLTKAATYLNDPNVLFIGTNCDAEKPSPNSNKFPESGCLIRAVEVATNRRAVILGKPEAYVSQYVIKKYSLEPKRTLMIGDNCSTDIKLGKRCGFKTLLVLTGVTNSHDFEKMLTATEEAQQIIPDYYAQELLDVVRSL